MRQMIAIFVLCAACFFFACGESRACDPARLQALRQFVVAPQYVAAPQAFVVQQPVAVYAPQQQLQFLNAHSPSVQFFRAPQRVRVQQLNVAPRVDIRTGLFGRIQSIRVN